jgi:two-component system OmpR family response regulator
MDRPTILIVDDSAVCRQAVRFQLEEGGYRVVELGTPFGFSNTLNRERPALVLLDVEMPAISGDQLARVALTHRVHQCPIVFHSNCAQERLTRLVRESGVAGFIIKGGDSAELLRSIARFLA